MVGLGEDAGECLERLQGRSCPEQRIFAGQGVPDQDDSCDQGGEAGADQGQADPEQGKREHAHAQQAEADPPGQGDPFQEGERLFAVDQGHGSQAQEQRQSERQ